MYLNTTSGLTPALDAIGASIADNAKFQARQSAYESAGILPSTGKPQSGGFLASLLGLGSPNPAPAQSAPVATASSHIQGPTADPGLSNSSPSPSTPSPLSGFSGLIDKAQQTYGIPAGYLPRLAAIESKFDPNAVSPTGARGLFQFTSGTASKYGLQDPSDVASSVDAAARLTADNIGSLTKSLGRAPTMAEAYLAHQQGAAGAAALLKNPSMPAGQVLASIGADPANITRNGGDPNMPAGVFAMKWTSRFGGGGGPMPGAVDAQATAGTSQGSFPNAPAALSGITLPQIQALIRNKETEQIGLKLWESASTGKDYDFATTQDGAVIRQNKRTGQADIILHAPVKQGFQQMDGRLLATDPQSGTARDVTPVGMPQGYRPATAQERSAYGVGPTTPFFFGADGKPATLQGGTQVTVNNAVNPILKGMGDQFVESAQGARDAADTIRSVQNARTQFQGGIIAGFGADESLALHKLGTALGLNLGDPNKAVNTEAFRTQIKPLVLSTVKGLGAGSGISNADRDFAEAAVGGSIKLEPATIARVLDITERAARAKIDRHNALAGQMLKTQPDLAAVGPMLQVQMPPASASSGGMPTLSDPSQAAKLPSGTQFRTPDGRIKVVP